MQLRSRQREELRAAAAPGRPRATRHALLVAAALLAACTAKEPAPITSAPEGAGAPLVRRTVPESAVVAKAEPARTAPAKVEPALAPPRIFPPNAVYVCVAEVGGQRRETEIEFVPKVADLCRKHPEMGPCQYERDVCRRAGGRVYASGGVEITRAMEDEYDKKVMRVRFRAN